MHFHLASVKWTEDVFMKVTEGDRQRAAGHAEVVSLALEHEGWGAPS